ncbi:MAG: phosphoribosylglycinamide formyltransferase [Candidatus Pelagibacter sp. TMED64]|nr:phosphoribosylglycinamide formyltransferase [Candidatus Pelagibacter sp.]OUU67329.1 MAG: phosphoribosylglycinamide formyltransferase [Candidatus Pelagibacter sp. TMED64]
MVKKKKVSTCVFISGNGTNLKKIFKNSKNKNFPIKIDLVISNNAKAKGIIFAKKNNIKVKCIKYINQKSFEKNSLILLKKNNIKLICLAGFMKILSSKFITQFKYKILNIHPSLLPKYKGLNTHMRVIKNKEKFSGCTVHFVNKKLDSGKIILQKKIKIQKKDTHKSLNKKILKLEYIAYSLAIKRIFKN